MKPLPKIEAAEQMHLARDTTAVSEVEHFGDSLARRITRLDPMAIIAAATAQFPDMPPELAFRELQREVNQLIGSLEAHGVELKAIFEAERERIAPVLAKATRRHFEILTLISSIDGRMRCNVDRDEGKRARLRNAGLTGSELESVTAPTDNSALLAERGALQVENEALLEFIRTKEERHLPEGFAKAA